MIHGETVGVPDHGNLGCRGFFSGIVFLQGSNQITLNGGCHLTTI
jgi:hypothetical protein